MRILVATDGTLPLDAAVSHVQRLWRNGDTVTVMTAINLPRQLLRQLSSIAASEGVPIETIVDAAGPGMMGMGGGDRVADRLRPRVDASTLDEVIERYYRQVAEQNTQPLVDALSAVGIPAGTVVRETQDRTAATIIEVCRDRKIDLLVIGTTGRGRFEGRLGSTGTKLVRLAPADILLVRVPVTERARS